MTDPREWRLIHSGKRPFTANSILNGKNGNKYHRAKLMKEYREHFEEQACDVPELEAISITVIPHLRNRRSIPDVAAGCICAKACIDGIVDAGVIPDDNPTHLHRVIFERAIIDGWDGLELIVREILDGES